MEGRSRAGVCISWRATNRRTNWLAGLFGLDKYFFTEPPPYLRSIISVLWLVLNKHPRIVLIQGTHGPLLFLTLILKAFIRYLLVVDAHSGFITPFSWKSYFLNMPFHRLLRLADIVIFHNYVIAAKSIKEGIVGLEQVVIVYDPPINFVCPRKTCEESKRIRVVLPSGGLSDEPIKDLLRLFQQPPFLILLS